MRVVDQGFHIAEKLGVSQSTTPEGFLLCESVPIARTGLMMYGDGEILAGDGEDILVASNDGMIRVTRHERDVFHVDTIASFLGKPVTDDHPDDMVTPHNWRQHAIGTTHNVRRGEGLLNDCLVADLLITDAAAIKAVQDGKREVSCGYDADYEQSEPGHAKQFNIIGNHVALVDRGRCGPRCAIGDKAMKTRDAAPKKVSFLDRLTAKLKGNTGALTADAVLALARDAEKEDEEEDKKKKEGESTKDAIAGFQKTIDSLPALIAAAVKDAVSPTVDAEDDDEDDDEDDSEEEKERKRKAKEDKEKGDTKDGARGTVRDAATIDAKTMRDVIQTIRSHAEVLAPGHQLSMPTFDSKGSPRVKFTDSMCACKRKALDVSYRTEAGRAAIEPFLAGRAANFDTMNAKTIDAVFTGAAALMATRNNDAAAFART
jgi:hypothetical protein